MTSPIGDVGTGATITFGTTDPTYFGKILNLEWNGMSRESIKITAMSDTIDKFIVGDLYDPGELIVDVLADVTALPPIAQAAEDVTLNFGTAEGDGTWKASGFLTSHEVVVPLEDKIVASCTVKFTGAISWAAIPAP